VGRVGRRIDVAAKLATIAITANVTGTFFTASSFDAQAIVHTVLTSAFFSDIRLGFSASSKAAIAS